MLPHIYFFFSSRRRHTRCYRDWSSDVCSSDLVPDRTSGPVCGGGGAAGPSRTPLARPERLYNLTIDGLGAVPFTHPACAMRREPRPEQSESEESQGSHAGQVVAATDYGAYRISRQDRSSLVLL